MSKAGQEKVKQIITDRIIEQLSQGVVPWRKPWVGVGGSWNRLNGKQYSLINQMLLDDVGEYATFNCIKNDGGKVNKGAKGSYVLEWFFTEYTREDKDGNTICDEDTGEPKKFKRWQMKYEKVFNIERDTNLKPRYDKKVAKLYDGEPIEVAENCLMHYIKTQKIKLVHAESDRAYYSLLSDSIHLPTKKQFKVMEEYYSTAFHESAHSTGHSSRLDRIESTRFGSKKYGKEELVAELTSAAVCNTLGIEVDVTFKNSASYIDNWVKAIKGGEADIISASAFADKAYALILDGFEGAA